MQAEEIAAAVFDWRQPRHWLAFGFGSGLLPRVPGTAGTLTAVPLYLLLQPLNLTGYVALLLLMFVVGIWVCGETAREMGAGDPSSIVWDEVIGFLVTMAAAPAGWLWVLVGFLLFRFFDILKPWPIRQLDRNIKGGLGIMLDDFAAGVMAWMSLQMLAVFFG